MWGASFLVAEGNEPQGQVTEGPQSYTGIPSSSPSASAQQASSPAASGYPATASSHKRYYALAVFVIAVIIFGAVYAYLYSNSAKAATTTFPTTIVSNVTTTVKSSASNSSANLTSEIFGFVSNYKLSNSLVPLVSSPFSSASQPGAIPQCVGTFIIQRYLSKEYNLSMPLNFSQLNQSGPFFDYLLVTQYNDPSAASKLFYSNGGYCNADSYKPIISNSTFSDSKISIDGNTAYLIEASDLTPQGIRYAIDNYTGTAPSDVSYFIVKMFYKNVSIAAGEEGFSGSMNVTALVEEVNNTFQHIKGFWS